MSERASEKRSDRHPILLRLITEGEIFVEGGDYVGIDPTGEEVFLGTFGEEDVCERYLSEHPGPEYW